MYLPYVPNFLLFFFYYYSPHSTRFDGPCDKSLSICEQPKNIKPSNIWKYQMATNKYKLSFSTELQQSYCVNMLGIPYY